MTGERPYPLDQPQLTTDIGPLLASHGANFDGTPWLLMEQMVHPYEEIFLVAALVRETVRRTQNTMHLRLELVETPHGCVMRVAASFFDNPVEPTQVDTFLNPGAADLRRWLRDLTGQTHISVLQLDCHTGNEIKWTRHHVAPEIPDTARRILGATWEDTDADLERWVAAVRYCQERLGPPRSGIRPLADPGSKAGRNDPCPCGSGLKFKRCHGA